MINFKPAASEYGWSDPIDCRRLTEKGELSMNFLKLNSIVDILTCKKQGVDNTPYTYCVKVDYGGPKDKKQNRKNNAYLHQRTVALLVSFAFL